MHDVYLLTICRRQLNFQVVLFEPLEGNDSDRIVLYDSEKLEDGLLNECDQMENAPPLQGVLNILNQVIRRFSFKLITTGKDSSGDQTWYYFWLESTE